MKTIFAHCSIVGFVLLGGADQLGAADPLSNAFTYQGRLTAGTSAYTGNAEFQPTLWNAASGGSQVAANSPATVAVVVTNGLFVLPLDFGAGAFPGEARWLQLGVRTTLGSFTVLDPRQELQAVPYALYAPAAGSALSVAANSVVNASLQSNAVTSDKIADGTIVAADLSPALASNTFWQLGGNAATTPGVNFLGTTDNQPLEVRVNGARGLRLQPTPDDASHSGLVNLVGGWFGNSIAEDAYGSVIAGGGAANYHGNHNVGNRVSADLCFLGNGFDNAIERGALYSFLGSGFENTLSTNADNSFIGSGLRNRMANDPSAGSFCSFIGSGTGNDLEKSFYSFIGGGMGNSLIQASDSFLGGGAGNSIQTNALYSFLGGGEANCIETNATRSVLAGGSFNTNRGAYSTVPGGLANLAGGPYSLAAGRRAKAKHDGAFVWADSTDADFTSTAANQFLIRAGGGVGIGTASPQQALHVVGDALVKGTNFASPGSTARLILGDGNHVLRSVYGGGLRFGVYPFPDALVVQDDTGNVGVGTSSPGAKLHVAGRIRMDTWTADGTAAVYKNANGDLGVQASDLQLKKNVTPIRRALEVVAGLRGVTFNWRNEAEGKPKTVGLIAQEVRAVMPELTFECRGEDGATYLGVHYEKVAAVLVNAVQEQQARLEAQRSELDALKARLDRLERQLTTKE